MKGTVEDESKHGRCIGTTETQNMHKYNNAMGANLCTTVTPEKENMYKDE